MTSLAPHIELACARIAPTWPLDQFIAVNPYWGWVGQPMPQAAAALEVLGGTRLTMPRSWFAAQWQAGYLQRAHLQAAVARAVHEGKSEGEGTSADSVARQVAALVGALEAPDAQVQALQRLPLITDLRDAGPAPRPGMSWAHMVTHQVSQHCAAFFDTQQASWGMQSSAGLWDAWRQQLAADRGLPWHHGHAALAQRLATMPSDARAVIAQALTGLGIAEQGRTAYLSAVLMAIGGWGAWCAYERWQAKLAGKDDDQIEQLLAIRLTWEWLLHDDAPAGTMPARWAAQWSAVDAVVTQREAAQALDWQLQDALEIAYQQPLVAGLAKPTASPAQASVQSPSVQALFCIDVRSEVFRRALEGVDASVQTRGFAGFFGLPIAYSPVGSGLTRPQLPGLLAPALCVTESTDDANLAQVLAGKRRSALQWRARWDQFRAAPASGFSFVESLGLLYGAKLVRESLPSGTTPARWEDAGLSAADAAALRPQMPQALTAPAEAAAIAKTVLTAMGMVRNFAPLVLLAGHGSQSANNAHAAGLDCGACGGQTGEVNARALADLLNTPAVREHLAPLGITLSADTHFVPGLHNTTTDELVLWDTNAVPPTHTARLAQLRTMLQAAGERARAERAGHLGLAALAGQPQALQQSLRERANDWAQVRPEWGLANNAAFIVAPRTRSQHLHLGGRAFLHDYDHRLDPENSVLTLIMTAPMVVTNWINLQYHASTVDNRRYGSGNKLLHNVVGGRLGVFEGNGGDLRIGLPMQSLHDGHELRHNALRLSVFIEAPREAIDAIMEKHAVVRDLIGNGWMHLFWIEPQGERIAQCWNGQWLEVAP
ncbi:MAG: DUF2309 domain-containing protein [Burkholderiaceae bacterium]|nr:DUF2309 domain-containing protein [Burkholderiaceae bacterium]